jgi:RimJ/RimL family protein N-acetyltransferase
VSSPRTACRARSPRRRTQTPSLRADVYPAEVTQRLPPRPSTTFEGRPIPVATVATRNPGGTETRASASPVPADRKARRRTAALRTARSRRAVGTAVASRIVEVRGPTLTLRYAGPQDAPALFELARDPEVTRFFAWSYERPEQAAEWIAGLPARREAGSLLDFLVVHRERGPIGVTGLSELARRDRRATIGTWFGRDHWGTGANRESKALIAALAFRRLGLERLTAYTSTGNPRSQAALERSGFVREGTLRAFHRHPSSVHDVVVFGLLRTDWEASPLHAVPVEVAGHPPPAFVLPG